MPDADKMDGARSARDSFFEDLDNLRTGAYDQYRKFMLRYFSSQRMYDKMDGLITYCEIGGIQLTDPDLDDFRKEFRKISYSEFFKKKERFPDETIQLGFMR